MFIELVDALRCPNAHEETWLVAAALRMEARHIVEGTLGCPVCGAEYPIHDGVVDFRRGDESRQPADAGVRIATDDAMRLAALLDLSTANGFAVLLGAWGGIAQQLSAEVETPLVLIDPPGGTIGAPGISVLRCDAALPLAQGAARAIAIDDANAGRMQSAVRATKAKGRVVAPASVGLPDGVRELARDDALWVGEREAAASPVVTLHVRRSVS